MATTTNFGWETPDDTDLVKDGAAAIRTLGGAIDTSLVDLKGGTTGQILSKASNTDMDFTWTSANPGDITEVTAGTGLTGGGTSGAVSLAFDVANYGGGQYAAGKNKIINGDFGIWQRGTSITVPNTTTTYTADRFYVYSSHTAGTATFSQQTFTAGTAPVSGYEGTFFGRLTCGSTTTNAELGQRIENVRTFANQTVTVSFWAKASANTTLSGSLFQDFGSGGSTGVYNDFPTTCAVTTSWQRFSRTIVLPSISGKTIGTNNNLRLQMSFTPTASQTFDIWGVQVEAGSTATPFQTATGTIQGELAACQRYYYRVSADSSGNSDWPFGTATGQSTTGAFGIVQYPVTMRVIPSSIDYSGVAIQDGVNARIPVTTLTAYSGGRQSTTINISGGTGITQYRPYFIGANNNTTGYIGFSAEL